MPRILLIDDEQHIVDIVEYVLKENGFDVIVALDGDTGLSKFRQERVDLVLLDLMLPGMSGLDLFRALRRVGEDIPVIMLTSKSEEIDRVLGLELGADDYVTKPFSPRELAARVKAVLRRKSRAPSEASSRKLSHGPFELDQDSFSLSYFGTPIVLTRSEFKLMECLVRYPAQVFTRDLLMDRIHDGEHNVTDRSIDAYVKRLRRKFSEVRDDIQPVETVHGLGYKLNSKIVESTGRSESP